MKILAICGSLQAESGNLVLLRTAAANAPRGVEVRFCDGLRDLPHFNPDIESQGTTPGAVRAWREAIATSDALLIATPEYGHSLPGALKNAIDWVIGSGELNRKVVGVTAATADAGRGRLGLQALQDTLLAVDASIVGGAPTVRGPDFEHDVAELVNALIKAVEAARLAASTP
jgi:NAD(P)H-dependent FMN reductase